MWSQIKTNLERLGGLLKIENDFKRPKSDGVKKGEIQVKSANFSWDGKKDVLQDVNMSVEPGSLICVVGAVGSGKTTLVNGLLSLLNRTKGSVRVCCLTVFFYRRTIYILNRNKIHCNVTRYLKHRYVSEEQQLLLHKKHSLTMRV